MTFLVLEFWGKKKRLNMDSTHGILNDGTSLPPPPLLMKTAKHTGLGEKPLSGIGTLGGVSPVVFFLGTHTERDYKGKHSC